MLSRAERRQARKKPNKFRAFWGAVFLAVLLVAVAGASYIYFTGTLGVGKPVRQADFATDPQKLNILVLGVDERSYDKGRSDTMFVVTVDQKAREISLLSVPRDTRVKIPGYGWDKINHAYADGGPERSRKAVEALLGIPVDYYVTVNFQAFYRIVDAVGGVDIDVEKRMYYEDPYDNLVINLKPGLQHMDGQTAIKYVRYRDGDGDLGRVERQQNFLKAMLKQVAGPAVIPKIPAIIREVGNTVKTDLTVTDMLNLARLLSDAQAKGLKTDMIPGRPAYIADISYWLPDVISLREHVAQVQNIPMSDKYQQTSRSLQTEYDASIPKEMKVVEVPKSVPAKPVVVSPGSSDTKGVGKPPAAAPPSAPTKDSKLSVEIVNAAGAAGAGDKAAAMLRGLGFDVAGITTTASVNKNTVVIANTTKVDVVNKLSGLPFRYALQVTKNDAKANTVTVILGRDFVEPAKN